MKPSDQLGSTYSRFLSKQELIDLTGKRAASAQRRALDFMKLPYIRRPDGTPVVTSGIFESRGNRKNSPNWESLS